MERKKYLIDKISSQHRHLKLDKTDASHSKSCTEIHVAFTYFSQKPIFQHFQSLTGYYIKKNVSKRSQNSETVVLTKLISLKMDVEGFSVLELEDMFTLS